MTAAAVLALHGLPAARFLQTDDAGERLILMAVAKTAQKFREQEQKNLAAHIANALAGKRR